MISVVIQVYNRKVIFEKTLISLRHQKLEKDQAFEVIVVDNESTENIHAVIKKFTSTLDITYIKRDTLNHPFAIASGRNLGIYKAKYTTILVLDSDIYLPTTLISKLITRITSLTKPFLMTAKRTFIDSSLFTTNELEKNSELYKEFKPILSESNYFQPEDNRFSHGNIVDNVKNNINPWAYFYGMFTCFPKYLAEELKGYDESFDGHWGYEDIDFSYRLSKKYDLHYIIFDKECVYHQEPMKDGSESDTKNDRLNKKNNPNWIKICQLIPEYNEWKSTYYKKLAGDIVDV